MQIISRTTRPRTAAALTGTILSLAVSQVLADAAADEKRKEVEEVVVTGSRVSGLKAVESSSPVQVLDGADLESAGKPDLMNALANTVPSFTAQAFGGDMANQTLQAKLRGLSPNHVLVLVNGKRRHTTASLAVLGGPYQGGAGVDLNFIPVDSIDHIEVLTEGAAAQYGTDAIAGVINIILKQDDAGGGVSYTHGGYYAGDGDTDSVAGSVGFAPTSDSFLNFAGESRQHAHTDRGGIDPRVVDPSRIDPGSGGTYPNTNMPFAPGYPYLNNIFGDAEYDLKLASFNSGIRLGESTEVYAFGTWGEKYAGSYENYRLPNRISHTDPDTGEVTYMYPYGFDPREEIQETDYQIAAGIQGDVGDWRWDFASTYGKDDSRTIITNHALQIIYAPREQQDANDYSDMLGYTTVRKRNRSQSHGAQGSVSFSESEERRALMLPQELKAMGFDKEVFLYEGIPHPVKCDKIKYYQDKYFTQRLLPKVEVPKLKIGGETMLGKATKTVTAAVSIALAVTACRPDETGSNALQDIESKALRRGSISTLEDLRNVKYKRNPRPKQRYEVTMTIQGAPGRYTASGHSLQYDVVRDGCLPPRDNFEGIQYAPTYTHLPFTLAKVAENTYLGTIDIDAMLEEDVYGHGVCHWRLAGIFTTLDIEVNGEHFEVDPSLRYTPEMLVSGQASTSYFWSDGQARRDPEDPSTWEAQGPRKYRPELKDSVFSVTFSSKAVTP